MDDDRQNFLNRIQHDRSQDSPLIDRQIVDKVFKKVTDKILRVNNHQANASARGPVENIADRVIRADNDVRKAVEQLILTLVELGDKEIALKLISGHIFFLNDIFKDFDQTEQKTDDRNKQRKNNEK